MFVRITTDRTSRPNSLNDLGMPSDSDPIVSLSEFTYKKGLRSMARASRPSMSIK